MGRLRPVLIATLMAVCVPALLLAQDAAPAINGADTAWMLTSTALVLLMTPALAFFYGGLVGSKNVLNTMMMSFIALAFIGVLWAVLGYSLAFGTGNDWIGDTSFLFLRGVGLDAKGTIPHLLFMSYQATFAIITAALISGAIIGRMRVLGLRPLHQPLGDRRLQPDRSLGVGRRMAGQDGRARLRRRNRRARERRHRGLRGRLGARSAPRLSENAHPAAQRAVHAARRRPAVVRVVRIQLGQRAGGKRHRGPGIHHDAARTGRDTRRVDAHRCGPDAETNGRRRRDGDRGRARGRHAGRRLHRRR